VDDLTSLAEAAMRPGDTAAMAAFIRASQREVWSLCAYLVDEASADDLTQETYLRVFRALPSFRGESSARTWLLSIARRVCMDELRRRSRRRRQENRMFSLGGQESAYPAETDEIEVEELLSHLPEDRRAAFVLTQITGLSYEDAARACDVPVGTIASRVARARTDLIAALGLVPAESDGAGRPTASNVARNPELDGAAAADAAASDGGGTHRTRSAWRRLRSPGKKIGAW
jgi:RNA polymerase sigma-70 factor, ECF subfamily